MLLQTFLIPIINLINESGDDISDLTPSQDLELRLTIFPSARVGALSVHFRHKSLLWYGLLCFLVSALGCAFSQSYLMMLLFYPLTGFARAEFFMPV